MDKVRCTKISIPGDATACTVDTFGPFRAQRAPSPYILLFLKTHCVLKLPSQRKFSRSPPNLLALNAERFICGARSP